MYCLYSYDTELSGREQIRQPESRKETGKIKEPYDGVSEPT